MATSIGAYRANLAMIVVLLLLLSLAFIQRMPRPRLGSKPDFTHVYRSFNEPKTLYWLNGVPIHLRKASVFRIEPHSGIQAVAIPTKRNLSPPWRNSVDRLIWRRLGVVASVDDACTTSYQEARDALFKQHRDRISASPEQPWVVEAPSEYAGTKGHWWFDYRELKAARTEPVAPRSELPRFVFVAGIEAEQDGEKATELSVSNGMANLCAYARREDLKHVAATLFGAGAGGLSKARATRALLAGANRAALDGSCPDEVTLVLFPGPSWDRGDARAHSGDSSLEAQDVEPEEAAAWLKFERVFTDIAEDGRSLFARTSPWGFKTWYIIAWQVCAVLAAVVASGLVACCTAGPRPTKGSLVQWSIGFTLAVTGVKIGGAIGPTALEQPGSFALVLVAALAMPYWKWKGKGDPKDPEG